MAKKKKLTAEMIRKATRILRAREKKRKFYKMEIRNWPFFFAMLEAGKIRETRKGLFEIVESNE